MADKFLCPFCDSYFVLDNSAFTLQTISSGIFNADKVPHPIYGDQFDSTDKISVCFHACPNCKNTTIKITGLGSQFKTKTLLFNPDSSSKIFPDYIPEGIRQDYEEACKIVNLSPKASATLARRCLQGMIRDYWKVSNKRNLYEEIQAIEDEVSPEVSRVLKGLKDLGNIGAHMEKDINLIINIDHGEAEKLIKLIEYLMKEWYINRYEANQLFNDIIGIDEAKKEQKKNSSAQ